MKSGWGLLTPLPRTLMPAKMRVAICTGHPSIPTDNSISEAIKDLSLSLTSTGMNVDIGAMPEIDIDSALECYSVLIAAEMKGIAAKITHGDQSHSLMRAALIYIGNSTTITLTLTLTLGDYLKNEAKRNSIKEKWNTFFKAFAVNSLIINPNHTPNLNTFEEYDAFLCPVASTAAIKHDHTEPMMSRTIIVNGEEMPYFAWAMWAGLIILADLPSTSCPIALTKTSPRLPIGVQVVTGSFQDRMSMHMAGIIEQCHYRFQPPPWVGVQSAESRL